MSKDAVSPPRLDFAGLSDAERILVAGELLDMIHTPMVPLTVEQVAELEHEDAQADAEGDRGVPWEIVKARLMLHR